MKVFSIQNQFGLENLKMETKPDPTPALGEVLVRIKSVSLNYRDYLTIEGKYNPRYKLPLIPMSDSAGEVVSIGTNVKDWKVGDRVMGIFAQDWSAGITNHDTLRKTLGGPLDGTIGELRIFPSHGLVRIPDHLSFTEASTLPCAALTAWRAMAVEKKTIPGETVLILGTGGVSIFALQFAKMMGARTIVTSGSNDKLEKAKNMGADHTINYREKENWYKEVHKIVPEGADHIIEVGGAGTLEQSLKSVRLFGHISLIGILAGGSKDLNLIPVLMQNVRVQGVIVGNKAEFEDMNRAISFHRLKPTVDKVFPFSETVQAVKYLRDGKHFGKVCIEIA